MKKLLSLLAAALLLPFSHAWAASYYAKLSVYQADGNPTGAGTVYASTSDTSSGKSTNATTSGSQGKPVSLYAWGVANDGYRLKGWTANKDGSDIIINSAVSPYEFRLNCSSTDNGTAEYSRYAVFEEKPARTLTFTKVGNGSYSATANGSKVDNPTELSTRFTVTFDASPDSGWKFVRWYQVGGDTLSEEKSFVRAFDADTAIGIEFKEKGSPYEVGGIRYKTIAEAVAALPGGAGEITLADDDEMENSTLPANVTLTIPKGSKLSISSGVTFTVNGTVAILGTLANSGTVSGSGKVVLYKHIFTQTGVGDQPITTDSFAGSNVKYYKTTLASGGTLTGTNPTCTYNHGARVMRNGALAAACDWASSVTPAGLYCSIDSNVAKNHITGFLSDPACYYTDTATAFAQVKNNTTTKMLLMLKTDTVSNTQLNNAGLLGKVGNYNKLNQHLGILDCASYKITIQPSYIDGAYKHIVLNGTYYVPTLFYGGGSTCINCTVDVTKAKGDYASVINIYDCAPGAFLKGFDGTAAKPSVNIYSSGDRVYNTSSFSSTSCYYIFGGHWATKPAEAFLSKITKDYVVKNCGATCPISGGADCWHIAAPSGDEAAQVGSVYYSSLKDALDAAAAKNNTTVTLLQACTLDQPWTLASGKTLRIELAGRQVTAPNGFIVNRGTLEIGDKNSSLSGNAVTAASGYLFDNYGTLRVAYGVYSGAVNLRKNSHFIMHHGHHTGAFSVESGADAKTVSDIRGGRFSQNMSSYLNDGYVCRGLGDGRYAVTLKPFAVVTPHSTSGYETGFKFVAMTDADKALYLNSSKVRSSYPVDTDWFRRAELVSYVDVYTGHYVDCLVKFDRRTEKGTVKVKANSVSTTLGATLEANVAARQLSPNLGDKQKRYSFFIDDSADGHKYDTLTLDIGNNNNNLDNIGTTCTVWMDLWTGSLGDVWESIPLDGGFYKFKGKGAIAGTTDYSSLQAAVDAVADGATVRLSQDSSAAVTVSATKTFILDNNNFAFSGSVNGGTGYSVTPTDLGDGKTQYAVTPIPYAITYELNGGQNHADNPATYTIESAAITLKDPTRAHYVFTGWTPAGTIAAGSTGDKSFAANWKLERVNVTVPDVAHMTKVVTVASGALEQVDATTYTVDYGVQVTVVYTAATGYEPASKECKIASATAGAVVPDVPTSKATAYAIAYVLGEGGVNHPDNPKTYTIEDEVTLKAPTRAGHFFMGWAEGDTIPAGSTGAKTFTATWKKSTVFYVK